MSDTLKILDPIVSGLIDKAQDQITLKGHINHTEIKKNIIELKADIRLLTSLVLILLEKNNHGITNEEIISLTNEINKTENFIIGKCYLNLIKENVILDQEKIRKKTKKFKKKIRTNKKHHKTFDKFGNDNS